MSQDKPSKSAPRDGHAARDERLAEALRANLGRRKQQARARDDAETPALPGSPGESGPKTEKPG